MCFHSVRGSMRGILVATDPEALVPVGRFIEVCKNSSIE